ncbi:SUR7/PalI family-domain-containing protein [Xylariomycetidae sp. FL0641]|nr:SUR7/PalI family-domain-containing protein [Xylariomycetidae sp. FL0641]
MAFTHFRKRNNAPSPSSDTLSGRSASIEEKASLKAGTVIRRNAIIVASFLYFVTVVFLILVEVGNTDGGSINGSIYFFRLDLANILPQSVPTDLTLQNSIARTLGLHDFYQVGLWNFCEGYLDEGITHCSKPEPLWWFNPVKILLNELFSGASIALPSQVNDILTILRIASHLMFGFFLTGLLLNFVLIFISPVVLYSRWWSLPICFTGLVSLILIGVATILGTAMSLIAKYALSSQPDLNVGADIGVKMFVFMWIASGLSLLSWIIHMAMGCCCTSRRDITTGRKPNRSLSQRSKIDIANGVGGGW